MKQGLAAAALVIVALLAGIALAVAIHDNQNADSRIKALQAQLRKAAPALSDASSRVSIEATKLATLERKFAKLAPQVAAMASCLPELQSELGGLEIKGETYAFSYISNPSHTSLACNKVLYAR